MQHQHQQFANIHSNHLTSPLFTASTTNQPIYYNQPPPNSFNNNNNRPSNPDLVTNTSQPPPATSSNSTNQSQSANNTNNNTTSTISLASQFTSSQVLTSRKDFLNYTLSLLRANTNEHRDSLPTIDISLLKHAAYVFDGIMFYLKCNRQQSGSGCFLSIQNEFDIDDGDNSESDTEAGEVTDVELEEAGECSISDYEFQFFHKLENDASSRDQTINLRENDLLCNLEDYEDEDSKDEVCSNYEMDNEPADDTDSLDGESLKGTVNTVNHSLEH